MTRDQWAARHPDHPWLSTGDCAGVARVLQKMGELEPGQTVAACTKAGEGNMNLTLRVTLGGETARRGGHTIILKQSRPWVEKYDFIAAPWDRANFEAMFLQKVSGVSALAARVPRVRAVDLELHIITMEDLGSGSDFSSIYNDARIDSATLHDLGRWLRTLHDSFRAMPDAKLANRAMRQLNHAHMFDIPLQAPPALELDGIAPGLAAAAADLRADPEYREIVTQAARHYLEDGECLLHGDFFPGSWLRTPRGVFVIDPEFCFFGDAEFDLGVAVAHLALAQTSRPAAEAFLNSYGGQFDAGKLSVNAGIEVMRRLIGVAQLPLNQHLDRVALLRRSRIAVLGQDWSALWPE